MSDKIYTLHDDMMAFRRYRTLLLIPLIVARVATLFLAYPQRMKGPQGHQVLVAKDAQIIASWITALAFFAALLLTDLWLLRRRDQRLDRLRRRASYYGWFIIALSIRPVTVLIGWTSPQAKSLANLCCVAVLIPLVIFAIVNRKKVNLWIYTGEWASTSLSTASTR